MLSKGCEREREIRFHKLQVQSPRATVLFFMWAIILGCCCCSNGSKHAKPLPLPIRATK